MKKIWVLACLSLLIVAACKKEEELSPTDLLTTHAWRNAENYTNGIATDVAACVMDNKLEFLADSIHRSSPGNNLCYLGETETVMTWYLELNDAILVIEAPAYTYRYKINFITTSRIDMEGMVNNKLHLLYLNRY